MQPVSQPVSPSKIPADFMLLLSVSVSNGDMTSSVAGVQAARIESNTPHMRRKHRRAKSGSKIEANGDGNGRVTTSGSSVVFIHSAVCFQAV